METVIKKKQQLRLRLEALLHLLRQLRQSSLAASHEKSWLKTFFPS
jgi:hypothetical protein